MSEVMDLTELKLELPDTFEESQLVAKDSLAAETLAILEQIYKEVWDDFYVRQAQDLATELASLSAAHPTPLDYSCPPPSYFAVDNQIMITEDSYELLNLTAKNQSSISIPVELADTLLPDPHPRYFFCTSLDKIQGQNEGASTSDLNYNPFSNDPRFDLKALCTSFPQLNWQRLRNSDMELIQLEAAKRIHFGQGIQFKSLKKLGLFNELRFNLDSISNYYERDKQIWINPIQSIFPEFELQKDLKDFSISINSNNYLSCTSLNCIEPWCSQHTNPQPSITNQPKKTSSSLKNECKKACGEGCFYHLSMDDLDEMKSNIWDDESRKLLKAILEVFPDESPCVLKSLCGKTCLEVFVQRRGLLSDFEISRQREEDVQEELELAEDFVLATTKVHAQRHAHASRIKFIANGIAVVAPNAKSDSQDVDVVLQCALLILANARGSKENVIQNSAKIVAQNSGRGCHNNNLQQRKSQSIVVKPGKSGLGAFAHTEFHEGDVIGEYTGDFVGSRDPFKTEEVGNALIEAFTDHTKLNYVYGLNDDDQMVDALSGGNETRFLNHSSKPNCYSEMSYVNGDLRMKISAGQHIKAGAELLLDYGSTYWKNGAEPDKEAKN